MLLSELLYFLLIFRQFEEILKPPREHSDLGNSFTNTTETGRQKVEPVPDTTS
jgi:hypothetical protein